MREMNSKLEKRLSRKMARAILQYKLIEEGDRIVVAVSGGKDSICMTYFLNQKQKSFPFSFELFPVYVHNEFAPSANPEKITTLLDSWGMKLHVININVEKRLKEGRKMNCYWCSTQRRTDMMAYAKEMDCGKMALGHHLDDILETFFMNMMYKRELSTMLPLMSYDNYDHTVIRPLSLIKESEIINFAEEKGFSQMTCTCGFDDTSKRKEVKKILDTVAGEGEFIKDNIYKALGNPKLRYLPVDNVSGKDS